MGTQLHATVGQVSATTSEARARTHTCLVDRPEPKGGSDRGPMGGELMLMGIGGCFMSNLIAAVRECGLEVSDLSVDVSATLEASPPRLSDIALLVHGFTTNRELLRELVARAEAACVSVNTAKSATEVTVRLA
jgi:putative redox protein